jgi:hypothetical protein
MRAETAEYFLERWPVSAQANDDSQTDHADDQTVLHGRGA